MRDEPVDLQSSFRRFSFTSPLFMKCNATGQGGLQSFIEEATAGRRAFVIICYFQRRTTL